MVTLEELCRAGETSPRTVANYQKRGLIPAPICRLHPGGRGRIGYWPDYVVHVIRQVKALQAQGLSLEQAGERIRASKMRSPDTAREEIQKIVEEWKTTKVVLGKTESQVDWLTPKDLFAANISASLVKLGFAIELAVDVGKDAASDAKLGWALELFNARHVPVLIYHPATGVRVTTDFLVAHELNPIYWRRLSSTRAPAGDLALGRPAVVLPLFSAIFATFEAYRPEYAKQLKLPAYAGAPLLYKYEDDVVTEAPYRLVAVEPTSVTGPTFTFSLRDVAEKVVGVVIREPARLQRPGNLRPERKRPRRKTR